MELRKQYTTLIVMLTAFASAHCKGESIDITVSSGYTCSFQALGIGLARGDVAMYHSTAQGSFAKNLGASTALGLWTADAAASYARAWAPVGSRFTLQKGGGVVAGSFIQFDGRKNLLLRRWTCAGTFTVTPPALQCQVSQIRALDFGTVNTGESVTRSATSPVSISCNAITTTSAKIQTQLQLDGQDVELTLGGKVLGLQPTVISSGVTSTTSDIVATIRDKTFSSVGVKSASTVLVLTFE